jgi:hypothetical protein
MVRQNSIHMRQSHSVDPKKVLTSAVTVAIANTICVASIVLGSGIELAHMHGGDGLRQEGQEARH